MPRVLTENDIADFRERLCELATRIYVERGPENFNMRLLAAEMGVSAMTPYRYFKDKDEIVSSIRARASRVDPIADIYGPTKLDRKTSLFPSSRNGGR